MSVPVLLVAQWRVEPCSIPHLLFACRGCARTAPFAHTGRFRVNANGARLDVWLLYRCVACGTVKKVTVHERVHKRAVGDLVAFETSRPDLVTQWAWTLAAHRPAEPVRDFVVHRDEVVHPGRIRLAVPHPVHARLDRVLARGLSLSRREVAGRVEDKKALKRPVFDGQAVRLLPP